MKDIYHFWKRYKVDQTQSKSIEAEYLHQKNANSGNVHFYNWWPIDNFSSLWLYRFVQNTGLMNGSSKRLNFCSMFNDREVLNNVNDGVKVFFSGENLRNPQWAKYADGLLEDRDCSLSLGFDYFENERYMRFPLWLTYVFEPTLDEKQIRERCEQLRYPEIGSRDKFACLIARADNSGLRTEMYNRLSEIGTVDCPSVLFHNDDSLKELFDDNKVAYMRQYRFNICPENANAYGYCTEKVFESIAAGCIPVYWGSYNIPEPKILNHEAIIFWDCENEGQKAICKIDNLNQEHGQLEAFIKQPRLVEGAENEVIRMMNELFNRLKVLIYDR